MTVKAADVPVASALTAVDPICGMTLEPVVAADTSSQELADFTRRMWISASAAVPLVILTMGAMVGLPVRDWFGHDLAAYLEFALATPVVLWAVWPFFQRGWASVVNHSPNMWRLIFNQGCRCLRVIHCGLVSAGSRMPTGPT